MKQQKILKTLNSLREQLKDMVPTKNDVIPDDENLATKDIDEHFDIDIFFSRKPGMRRSIQLITSNCEGDDVKVSCLTAMASLCDTLIANKQLNVTEQDIALFMQAWLEMHDIDILALSKNK